MSKLIRVLLWVTVPALLVSRMAENRLSRGQEFRLVVTDSLTRFLLLAGTVWMRVRGDWGIAALLVGLLALLAALRAFMTSWLLSRTNPSRR